MAKTALPQVIWTPGRAEEPPTSGLAFIVAVASRPNPSAAAPPIGPRRLKTPDDDGNQGVPSVCLWDPFVTPLRAALAAAQNLGVARRTHRLHHLEDALAHAAFPDLVVGTHQFERLALDQRILLLLEGRAGLAEALAAAARHRSSRQSVRRHLIEE